MSEETIALEGEPKTSIYNPFPDERRASFSPEEKLQRWIKEQGDRDRKAAQLMRDSKKQRKTISF